MTTDFETWIHDYNDRIFRFWVYKKAWTPYEMEQKFTDESLFEDVSCGFCFIEEAINIGNDWLLGLRIIYEGTDSVGAIEYYKLSEIRLGYLEEDEKRFHEEWQERDDLVDA